MVDYGGKKLIYKTFENKKRLKLSAFQSLGGNIIQPHQVKSPILRIYV